MKDEAKTDLNEIKFSDLDKFSDTEKLLILLHFHDKKYAEAKQAMKQAYNVAAEKERMASTQGQQYFFSGKVEAYKHALAILTGEGEREEKKEEKDLREESINLKFDDLPRIGNRADAMKLLDRLILA
jgi:hypothetical protein